MPIDLHGKQFQGLYTFIQFVLLNLIYMALCLPVVTIGMATSALYEVAFRYADDERGYLIKDFFAALRSNAKRGTAVLAVLGVPVLVAAYAALFWVLTSTVLGLVLGLVTGVLCLHLLASLIYGFALTARFDDRVRRTVHNALLLPAGEPARTLALLARPLAMLAIAYALPVTLVLWATIGFSVGAYLDALVLRSVFRRRLTGDTERISPHSGE